MAGVFAPITAANLALGYRLYRADRYFGRLARKFGLRRVYKHGKKYLFGVAAGSFGMSASTVAYPSKKRRISVSGTSIDAGATNVVQRSWHQSRAGKRPRKNAKLALRMLNATQNYSVLRFQRLSAYEGAYDASVDVGVTVTAPSPPYTLSGNRPLPLGHCQLQAGSTYYTMPVQLFDLTSISSSPEGVITRDASCNFSLGYDSASGNYYWFAPYAKGPQDDLASYSQQRHWWMERGPSGITSDARPQITKSCYCPWVDIRMVLYGATTETTRFTVMMVQLKDQFWDPLYLNSSAEAASGSVASEKQQAHNQFWNTTLKPKVYNPIASAGVKTEGIYKILSKKTYVIGPDTGDNPDVFQPNIVCKKFYNMNRIQRFDWFKPDIPAEGPGEANPCKIDTNAELDDDAFNQYMRADTKATLHPKAKVFLLVMADCYNQQTFANSAVSGTAPNQLTWFTGLPTNGATKVPCMDIIIRKKLIYDDT